MDEIAPIRAPELDGTDWLNTDGPLKLAEDLRGKVVLLDFWSYCCINCLHVLPMLRRLEERFAPGLAVIGVHSAKFLGERSTDSLRRAIARHDITHPVVSDPYHRIWDAYTIQSWPTFVVIDPAGYIVGSIAGEGHDELLAQTIAEQIETARNAGQLNEEPVPGLRPEADGTSGQLTFPGKVLASGDRLYIADSGAHRLLVTGLDGAVIDVIGDGRRGSRDGSLSEARFANPQGMALAGELLYVADTDNHTIRCVDLAAARVETLVGTGAQGLETNLPGHGRDVALNSPWDLHLMELETDGDRFLFVAMAGWHQLWVIDLSKGNAYPYAGSSHEALRDGLRPEACLAQPSGLAFDGTRLFVADAEASAVRCVDLNADTVTTVIGHGLFVFGDRDGSWDEGLLQHPMGVVADGTKLYLADTYNHKIKTIDLKERTVATLAGDGEAGHLDGTPGRLFEPSGLSLAGDRLFVADTNNHAIRTVHRQTGAVDTIIR